MHRLIPLLTLLMLAPAASAQHYEDGDIHIMGPWSRALPPVAKNGAAYLELMNHGATPDRLVGASSPMADRVEMHTHTMEGGMMKMRQVPLVDLPPGEHVRFEPGGLHLMLFGLKKPLTEGDSFPVTLQFERAPPIEVTVTVMPVGTATGQGHDHGQHAEHDKQHEAHAGAGHDGQMNMPAPSAPTLGITLVRGPSGAYLLRLDTGRFHFAKEHAGGGHVPGEGHAHLYVDGVKIGRIYAAEHELAPLGQGNHEIVVALYTNNHAAYAVDGIPVAERMVLRVPAGDVDPATGEPVVVDLDIRGGKLDRAGDTVRVNEGEAVALRWSSDQEQQLHLHGFDIEATVAPQSPVTMRFDADLTGRFPVAVHEASSGSGHGHGHANLLYLEVHPK